MGVVAVFAGAEDVEDAAAAVDFFAAAAVGVAVLVVGP